MNQRYEAILKSALILFAEKGFDGTGLRKIAKHAGVAQPTINYHFKTKQKLFDAVATYGAELTTNTRMAELDALMQGPEQPRLEDIVRILFEVYNLPVDKMREDEEQYNQFVAKLGYGDSVEARNSILKAFDEMAHHFISAMVQTDEGFDRVTATRAYLFSLPVGMHAVIHQGRLPCLAGIDLDAAEAQYSFDNVIDFICAGMRSMAKIIPK